ncbi:methyltransferase, partial [Thermithiobacillus plumbiphilus]
GSGAGGLVALNLLAGAITPQLTLADINPQALLYAQVNAALAGQAGVVCENSDVLRSVPDPVDLVLANPPYLVDPQARLYRDGGGSHGCDLSVRIVRESLERLAPGGMLILYTGTVIVAGEDIFLRDILPMLQQPGICYEYGEMDPDVFGEELEHPAYAQVERIAVVSLVVQKPGSRHG